MWICNTGMSTSGYVQLISYLITDIWSDLISSFSQTYYNCIKPFLTLCARVNGVLMSDFFPFSFYCDRAVNGVR